MVRLNPDDDAMFEVIGYENRHVFVRCRKSGEIYQFEVGEDGALTDSELGSARGEARHMAIAYLFRLRRAALLV